VISFENVIFFYPQCHSIIFTNPGKN